MTFESIYARYRQDSDGLETFLKNENSYKFLGWQVTIANCDDLKKCFELGHMGHQGIDKKKVFDIQHSISGSDCTYWCDECGHFWKIDMSD